MANLLQTTIQAESIAAAIRAATGQKADILYTQDGRAKITFPPQSAKNIQLWIENQMKKKSDIDIDFAPIATPLLIKKLALPVSAAAAALFLTGYLIGKK